MRVCDFFLFKLTNATPLGSCRQLGTHLLEEIIRKLMTNEVRLFSREGNFCPMQPPEIIGCIVRGLFGEKNGSRIS